MTSEQSTISRVRLPVDEVVDRVFELIEAFPSQALDLLAAQTPFVVAGVLAKHRARAR